MQKLSYYPPRPRGLDTADGLQLQVTEWVQGEIYLDKVTLIICGPQKSQPNDEK